MVIGRRLPPFSDSDGAETEQGGSYERRPRLRGSWDITSGQLKPQLTLPYSEDQAPRCLIWFMLGNMLVPLFDYAFYSLGKAECLQRRWYCGVLA